MHRDEQTKKQRECEGMAGSGTGVKHSIDVSWRRGGAHSDRTDPVNEPKGRKTRPEASVVKWSHLAEIPVFAKHFFLFPLFVWPTLRQTLSKPYHEP